MEFCIMCTPCLKPILSSIWRCLNSEGKQPRYLTSPNLCSRSNVTCTRGCRVGSRLWTTHSFLLRRKMVNLPLRTFRVEDLILKLGTKNWERRRKVSSYQKAATLKLILLFQNPNGNVL